MISFKKNQNKFILTFILKTIIKMMNSFSIWKHSYIYPKPQNKIKPNQTKIFKPYSIFFFKNMNDTKHFNGTFFCQKEPLDTKIDLFFLVEMLTAYHFLSHFLFFCDSHSSQILGFKILYKWNLVLKCEFLKNQGLKIKK